MANTLIFFAEKKKWVVLIRKSYLHFLQQNINVFENTLATTVDEFVINELDKLTMF